MNANAITAKILDEARAQAALTLREAGERTSQIRMEAEDEANKKREAAAAQAEGHVAQMRERMLRTAELDQKKALLKVKRDVIDEAFDGALKLMQGMDDTRKKDYLEMLLLEASEDGETLIPDQSEAHLYDDAFTQRLNAALKQAGKKPITVSADSRALGGGFVLTHGGLEINCTFQSVMNEWRPKLEAEVAGALFGNN